MKNKGGAAHLEMVIAFIFFLGFVTFIFAVLKPLDSTVLTQNIADELGQKMHDYLETDYSQAFLYVQRNQTNEGCFLLQDLQSNFKHALSVSKVEYINPNEGQTGQVNSSIEGGATPGEAGEGGGEGGEVTADETRLQFQALPQQKHAVNVLISPELKDLNLSFTNCVSLAPEEYTIGSVFERGLISYTALGEIKKRYDADYEGFKEVIGIPKVFDISVTSNDLPEISMTRPVSDSVELFIHEEVFEVINSTGDITAARFTFSAW